MSSTGKTRKRLALLMSTEVGLKTQYLTWKQSFPTDIDVDPVFIVMDFWKEGGFIERLPLPGGIRGRIRGQLEVANALRQGPFDGIFIAVHSALALFSKTLDQVPCFMTFDVTPKQLHDFGSIYNKLPSKIAMVERFKHTRRSIAYQKCKALFPWSNWAAQSAINDYGSASASVHVVPPGVDLQRWEPGERWNTRSEDVCELLFVGGDFERKGGEILLNWVKKTKRTDFRLHIVTRAKLDGLDDSRICVYNGLMPNDPKLIDLYKQADVFVLPTLADCYSLASIEAMASGLPVVLAETGGTGDVIQNGRTGFLIRAGDAQSLAEPLEQLISSRELRVKMGKAARLDAESRYDGTANVRKSVLLMREHMGE